MNIQVLDTGLTNLKKMIDLVDKWSKNGLLIGFQDENAIKMARIFEDTAEILLGPDKCTDKYVNLIFDVVREKFSNSEYNGKEQIKEIITNLMRIFK